MAIEYKHTRAGKVITHRLTHMNGTVINLLEDKKMNRKEQIKLINNYYDRLHILNNYTWTPYRNKIYKLSQISEKEHRSGHPDIPRDFSANTAAKLFTVQYILEGMIKGLKSRHKEGPQINMTAIHQVRYEYLYGRSVGVCYCKDIREKISSKEAQYFLDGVDYAELMR